MRGCDWPVYCTRHPEREDITIVVDSSGLWPSMMPRRLVQAMKHKWEEVANGSEIARRLDALLPNLRQTVISGLTTGTPPLVLANTSNRTYRNPS